MLDYYLYSNCPVMSYVMTVLFHLVPQIPLIEANDGVSRQFFGLKVTQSGLKCISIGYNILFYIWEL